MLSSINELLVQQENVSALFLSVLSICLFSFFTHVKVLIQLSRGFFTFTATLQPDMMSC